MNGNYILVFAFGIGIVAGLRALTAPAVVSWAAHLGWLQLHDSPVAFMASTWAAILFSFLAVFELVADKLPTTPNRTAPPALAARLLTGGLCGACLCVAAHQALGLGAAMGAIGALAGAFGGYQVRKRLVNGWKIKDTFVALAEDVVAIGLACFLVMR
jgi:uncharacterized membrane protein